MEAYKETLAQILINGKSGLSVSQQKNIDKISESIEYAWNHWGADVIESYFEGDKPAYPNASFVNSWIDNEDFEVDGYDVNELKALFAGQVNESAVAIDFASVYSEEIEAGEVDNDTIHEWWSQNKENYPNVSYDSAESEIWARIHS